MSEFDREAQWYMSQQILRGQVMENGAIVAARPERQGKESVFYGRVWGRDVSYQIEAHAALDMPDAPEIRHNFMRWVDEKAPGIDNSVLLRKANHVNGPEDRLYNDHDSVQPDNNGSLLRALSVTVQDERLERKVMRKLANGLASIWDANSQTFRVTQEDQWENSRVESGQQNFFTHGLITAADGLKRAERSLIGYATDSEREKWEEAYTQMYKKVYAQPSNGGVQYFGKYLYSPKGSDNPLDAGLSLAVPACLGSDAPRNVITLGNKTIIAISNQLLVLPYSAKRYDGDTYSGIEAEHGNEKGAGYWPLLGFSIVKALREIGEVVYADYVQTEIESKLKELSDSKIIPPYHIPEQIFPDNDDRNGKGPIYFGWGVAAWAIQERQRRNRAA